VIGLISGLTIVWLNYHSLNSAILIRIFIFTTIDFISMVFYLFAMQSEEASRVAPLYGLTPVCMLITEWLAFGTRLEIFQYLGVAAVVLGAIFLSFKPGPARFNKKALFYVMSSIILWAVAVVFLSDIFQQTGYWLGWGWAQVVLGLLGTFSLIVFRKEVMKTIRESGHKVVYLSVSSEILSLTANGLLFFAAVIWLASLSSALTSVQYILVFLFTLLISKKWPQLFREEISRSILIQKLISIILIISGIFLISI